MRAQNPGPHRARWRLASPLSRLPPAEREAGLQNDPGFRRLPPERQQLLRQRLKNFFSRSAGATAAHAEPDGNLGASDARAEGRGCAIIRPDAATSPRAAADGVLPRSAICALCRRGSASGIIDSARFQGMFSPEERDIMRGATRLPLAPPENGKTGRIEFRFQSVISLRSQWKSCDAVSAFVTNSGSTRSAFTEITLS